MPGSNPRCKPGETLRLGHPELHVSALRRSVGLDPMPPLPLGAQGLLAPSVERLIILRIVGLGRRPLASSDQRAGRSVRQVVVRTRQVVNALAPAAGHPALKPDELCSQPGLVQQQHDYGCTGVPVRLAERERLIDETAESWRWIGRRL